MEEDLSDRPFGGGKTRVELVVEQAIQLLPEFTEVLVESVEQIRGSSSWQRVYGIN